MNWTLAISRNRDALLRIILELLTLAGMLDGPLPERLSRSTFQLIWNVLRAAESAVRRLIFIAAQNLVFAPRKPKSAPVGLLNPRSFQRLPAFGLIDPLKAFGTAEHQETGSVQFVASFRSAPPFFWYPAMPNAQQTQALCHRLAAIRLALENLPKQARRLVRWQARHRQLLVRRACRLSPFRPGLPPGYRQRAKHEVDAILKECHRLARDVQSALNTT